MSFLIADKKNPDLSEFKMPGIVTFIVRIRDFFCFLREERPLANTGGWVKLALKLGRRSANAPCADECRTRSRREK